MSDVIPYAPSLGWYAVWFRERSSGHDESIAVEAANRECGIAGKDFTRTAIGKSELPMLLSVAVEGGGSALKRRGAERKTRISLHGNWPHIHMGSLEAHYGRTPFYPHLMPELRDCLSAVALSDSLSGFNLRIHRRLAAFIAVADMAADGARLSGGILARGREIASALDVNMSVIDALMRYGPETSLALAAIMNDNLIK